MRALAIGIALFFCGMAAAQAPDGTRPSPSAVAQADAETMAAALALVDQDDLEKQMVATGLLSAEAAMQAELEAFRKRGIELPDDLQKQVRELVFDETNSMIRDMAKTIRGDTAMIYARYFTAAELRELKQLQSHPVMRKMRTLTPQLTTELSTIGMTKAAERGPDLERKVQALVEKWLADHADEPPPTS